MSRFTQQSIVAICLRYIYTYIVNIEKDFYLANDDNDLIIWFALPKYLRYWTKFFQCKFLNLSFGKLWTKMYIIAKFLDYREQKIFDQILEIIALEFVGKRKTEILWPKYKKEKVICWENYPVIVDSDQNKRSSHDLFKQFYSLYLFTCKITTFVKQGWRQLKDTSAISGKIFIEVLNR